MTAKWMVKEDLCDGAVEVQRISDKVMLMVLVFGEEIMRVICTYGPQSGKTMEEKVNEEMNGVEN